MRLVVLSAFIAAGMALYLTSCTDSSTVKVPAGQHTFSDLMINRTDDAVAQFDSVINSEGRKVAAHLEDAVVADSAHHAADSTAHHAEGEHHEGAHKD